MESKVHFSAYNGGTPACGVFKSRATLVSDWSSVTCASCLKQKRIRGESFFNRREEPINPQQQNATLIEKNRKLREGITFAIDNVKTLADKQILQQYLKETEG